LKYGIIEEAATHLRSACIALAPYDDVHYDVPQKGYGQPHGGPDFDRAVAAAKAATDDAKSELDFTKIDNGYRNSIKALNAILPYCKQ